MVKRVSEICIASFLDTMDMRAFYERTAQEFRIDIGEDSVFDCRKIMIASNILEKWSSRFETVYGKEKRAELMAYLCMVGPKTMKYLKEDEVEILPGFVLRKGAAVI